MPNIDGGFNDTRPPFPERCPNCNNKKDFRYLDNEVQCGVCGKMLKDLEGEKITKPLTATEAQIRADLERQRQANRDLYAQGSLSDLLADDIPPAGAFPICKEVFKRGFNLKDAEVLLVERLPLWLVVRIHGGGDKEVEHAFQEEFSAGLLDDEGHYLTDMANTDERKDLAAIRKEFESAPCDLSEINLTKIIPSVRFSHPVEAYIEKGHREKGYRNKLKRFNVSFPISESDIVPLNEIWFIGKETAKVYGKLTNIAIPEGVCPCCGQKKP